MVTWAGTVTNDISDIRWFIAQYIARYRWILEVENVRDILRQHRAIKDKPRYLTSLPQPITLENLASKPTFRKTRQKLMDSVLNGCFDSTGGVLLYCWMGEHIFRICNCLKLIAHLAFVIGHRRSTKLQLRALARLNSACQNLCAKVQLNQTWRGFSHPGWLPHCSYAITI